MVAHTKFREKLTKYFSFPQEECELYFKDCMVTEYVNRKSFFVQVEAVCSKLAFVNKGTLRMYYTTREGKEINVRFFLENDFVTSYQSFLFQKPGHYTIQALQKSELVTVPYGQLQHAFNNSMVWNKLGRIIAERSFVHAEQHFENLLFLDAEQRYLKLMNEHPSILESVPLYHIASYLGIERESLSRIRNKLRF